MPHNGVHIYSFFFFPNTPQDIWDLPQPRIILMPPELEVWSFNHWTAREVPLSLFIRKGFTQPSQVAMSGLYLSKSHLPFFSFILFHLLWPSGCSWTHQATFAAASALRSVPGEYSHLSCLLTGSRRTFWTTFWKIATSSPPFPTSLLCFISLHISNQ